MSLTTRLKTAGVRHHKASDGTTYILQRVNDANPFLQSGMFPAILEMIEGEKDPSTLETKDILARLAKDPKSAQEAIKLGADASIRKLEQGLVGELKDDGTVLRYTFTKKDLYDLQDGELNASLIPDELAKELTDVIDSLGRPAVEAQAIHRFPEEHQSAAPREAGERDGNAPQRGPVGASGA